MTEKQNHKEFFNFLDSLEPKPEPVKEEIKEEPKPVKFEPKYKPKNYPPKACVYCGKEFKPRTIASKTCCADCRYKFHRHKLNKKMVEKKKLKIICKECKKEFNTSQKWQKYCCERCRNDFNFRKNDIKKQEKELEKIDKILEQSMPYALRCHFAREKANIVAKLEDLKKGRT